MRFFRKDDRSGSQTKSSTTVTQRVEITVEREWTVLTTSPVSPLNPAPRRVEVEQSDGATTDDAKDSTSDKLEVSALPPGSLFLTFGLRSTAMKSIVERLLDTLAAGHFATHVRKVTRLSASQACPWRPACTRLLAIAALSFTSAAYAVTPPTISSNTFPSTAVGQTVTQTVKLTLTSASAIKSIALATGSAASKEYTLKSISGCTVDGTTVNASGTVCSLSVSYTPLYPGSLVSPKLSRNAQLLYTDGSSTVTAYGLAGAATNSIANVSPGTLTLYAGLPNTVAGTSPLDNGLGSVTGGYAGTGVAATSATFDFAPFNAIFSQNQAANATQPMAYDSQGNLYIIDLPNYVIRKIDNSASHLVTTIAGTAKDAGLRG